MWYIIHAKSGWISIVHTYNLAVEYPNTQWKWLIFKDSKNPASYRTKEEAEKRLAYVENNPYLEFI